MRRLLVVRLGSLGDLIHTLPAVSAIRRAHPSVDIDWLVDAAHRDLLELVPDITQVVELRDRTTAAWLDVRRRLRARKYDVALDFQGLLKSAALTRFSGATRAVGFDRAGLREGAAAVFYTESVPVGEGRHVIEKNLRLATAVGASSADTDAREFPIAAVESRALAEVLAQGLDRFAVINPGAAWPNKRWPAASFGALARHLADRHKLRSLVLWGPGEEGMAEAVVAASTGAALAAPPTRLPDLVAIARAAVLFISGDTGPTHIAGAVGTPIVALFGPTDPARNGPWDPRDVVVSQYNVCDCHYQRRCRREESWCLGAIRIDEIAAAVDRRLAG